MRLPPSAPSTTSHYQIRSDLLSSSTVLGSGPGQNNNTRVPAPAGSFSGVSIGVCWNQHPGLGSILIFCCKSQSFLHLVRKNPNNKLPPADFQAHVMLNVASSQDDLIWHRTITRLACNIAQLQYVVFLQNLRSGQTRQTWKQLTPNNAPQKSPKQPALTNRPTV